MALGEVGEVEEAYPLSKRWGPLIRYQCCMSNSCLRISATGFYAPPEVETAADLASKVGRSEEWILARSGVSRRHVSKEEDVALLALPEFWRCRACRGGFAEQWGGRECVVGNVALRGVPGAAVGISGVVATGTLESVRRTSVGDCKRVAAPLVVGRVDRLAEVDEDVAEESQCGDSQYNQSDRFEFLPVHSGALFAVVAEIGLSCSTTGSRRRRGR